MQLVASTTRTARRAWRTPPAAGACLNPSPCTPRRDKRAQPLRHRQRRHPLPFFSKEIQDRVGFPVASNRLCYFLSKSSPFSNSLCTNTETETDTLYARAHTHTHTPQPPPHVLKSSLPPFPFFSGAVTTRSPRGATATRCKATTPRATPGRPTHTW